MQKSSCRIDRMFHTLRWSLGIILWLFCIINVYLETHAEDLLQKAFYQAKTQETVINLGDTKNAVGNEILRQSVGIQSNLWQWCFLNGSQVTTVRKQACEVTFGWTFATVNGSLADAELYVNQCTLPGGGTHTITNDDAKAYCEQVLWGDRNVPVLTTTTQAPLIVQIAKWMLRLTIVLSITMVIYNGIFYIVESAKGGEVKEATKNLGLIVAGILVALLSLWIINLISSIGVSTLK